MGGLRPGKRLKRRRPRLQDWVTRDAHGETPYVTWASKPQFDSVSGYWCSVDGSTLLTLHGEQQWKRYSDIRLKPGEGPVEVTIKITLKE